jgi:hypothetical protein
MESFVVIAFWVALVGLIVFLLAWFGPRPSQWRTHDGDPVDEDDEPAHEPEDNTS